MRTFIRNTPTIAEYWDSDKKAIISIPLGAPNAIPSNLIEDIAEDVFEAMGCDNSVEAMQEKPDFAAMTVAELKDYARDHDIKLPTKAKKADIIEVLLQS